MRARHGRDAAHRMASNGITDEPAHHTLPFQDPDQMPEAIRLVRTRAEDVDGWRTSEVAGRALRDVGFEDAGMWTVEGLSGLRVALLAHSAQAMLAAVHFAGDAKPWDELSTFYGNGEEVTFVNLARSARLAHPGSRIVCVSGACALELYMRALTERPMGVLRPVSLASAAGQYEHSYARWRAWCRSGEGARARLPDARAA